MPITTEPLNYPTSKRPNPSKFHHNNRCLIPFHKKKQPVGNKFVTAFVTDRKPGQIIKSNDGKYTYQMQQNGSVVKVRNPQ